MKLTALLLALPLALGPIAAFADSTTTTESKSTNPVMGSTESSSKTEHRDGLEGKTVEKRDSVKEHADGSVSTESTKEVTKDQ
jgi:hypothetical protein